MLLETPSKAKNRRLVGIATTINRCDGRTSLCIPVERCADPSRRLRYAHVRRAADCSAAFRLLFAFSREMLPARVHAKTDAHAAGSHADADARTVVVVAAIIVAAAFNIALTRGIIVAVAVVLLNDDPPTTARTVAATIVVADQSHVLDAVFRQH
jgi:hypothetical protein